MRTIRQKYVLLFAIGVLLTVLIAIYSRMAQTTNASIEILAREAIQSCANESHKPSCYDRVIPEMTQHLTMEEAFEMASYVQRQDPSYAYCHVLGHELSARETRKDTDQWKAIVTRCPSGVCSNGCIHGAFQERFRADAVETDEDLQMLLSEIDGICESKEGWTPSGMERGSCYHALGHLLMLATGGQIDKALDACDVAARAREDTDPTQLCYDGAFMQIFQPLEPEDFALIAGREITSVGQHDQFCSQFDGEREGSCWTEGWPLHLEALSDGSGLTQFCSRFTGEERERCFSAIIYAIFPIMNLDPVRISDYCSSLPYDRVGSCLGDAAGRLLEVDWRNQEKAIGLCSGADGVGSDGCFETLAYTASYTFDNNPDVHSGFCSRIPDEWKDLCLGKTQHP